MEMLIKHINKSRIRVYITIEPFGLRIAAVFKAKDQVRDIALFVKGVMDKLGIKYELGRIELSSKRAILLNEYILEEFIANDEEIAVYSQEYGLQMKTLPGDGNDMKLPYYQRVELLYGDNNEVKKIKKNTNDNVIKEDKTNIVNGGTKDKNNHNNNNQSKVSVIKVIESKNQQQVNAVEHIYNEDNTMEKAILKSQHQMITPVKTKHVYKELIVDSDEDNN